jgi:hypothetical protein
MSTPILDRGPLAGRPPQTPAWGSPPPAKPPVAARQLQVSLRLLGALATFCTALCLGNLFDGVGWWLWPSAGAIAVAAVVGEAGHRLRIPALSMPLAYLIFGWLYVIPAAAHGSDDLAGASLIPSGDTWSSLRNMVDAATSDIRSLTVPVPDRPGFLLLTVAGVYLVAALVDIAVQRGRPALAGLPLLTLLAVPAGVVERGVGLLAFIAACASYLLLIFISGRRGLTRWARLPAGAAPRIRAATSASGRRIGAVALVAALVVPVLIPRYEGLARHHGGLGGGGGSATVVEPVVTLSQQLHDSQEQDLLTVRTTRPDYLRLTALETFDGDRFKLGSLSEGRDAQVARGMPDVKVGKAVEVRQTITVKPALHQRYLPVAYQATSIDVEGDWRLSGHTFTVFSAKTDTSGKTYSAVSEVATPTAEELRSQSADAGSLPSDVSPNLSLPSNLPVVVAQLTDKLTAGLTTEYDKAAAIQAYFRGPDYSYTLTGAPTGDDALEKFLTSQKQGYCEQFAAAMVVLARQAGVPARVAIGFTPGTRQPDGSWLITNHDAHSWPEIWFPQAGWVRFEPTPRDDSTTPPGYTLAPLDPTTTPSTGPSSSASASAAPSATASASASAAPSDTATATSGTNGGGGAPLGPVLGWTLGSLAAVLLLLTPAFVRRRRRAQRLAAATAGDSRQAWQEIVDTALDLGLELLPTLSPQRAVARLRHTASGERIMPDVSYQVFADVAGAEETARYAPAGDQPLPDIAGRLRVALGAWQRSQGWRVRGAALLVPRSMLTGVRGVGGNFTSDDSVGGSSDGGRGGSGRFRRLRWRSNP